MFLSLVSSPMLLSLNTPRICDSNALWENALNLPAMSEHSMDHVLLSWRPPESNLLVSQAVVVNDMNHTGQ